MNELTGRDKAILDMANKTLDRIFICMMRGKTTREQSRSDMEFLANLRENLYQRQVKRLDYAEISKQITAIFLKYAS